MDQHRKQRLREATRTACAAFTKGMKRPHLEQRLSEVQAKIKASTDRDGRPLRGMAERVAACKEEAARIEGLIAKAR